MKEYPVVDKDLKKSNYLISSKYKSSLLENKIMAISLEKISSSQYREDGGNLIVSMSSSEIKRLLKTNSGSIYERLENVAKSMTGRSIGWSNPEEGTFDYIAAVVRATYTSDGVFTMEFNKYLKNYLVNLKENFTILNLPTMLSFKNNSSFRLYELLRSKCYYPKGKTGDDKFIFEFMLSELKLELGIVNPESEAVKHLLRGESYPDFDKAVEAAPEKTYERWSDFKRNILDKAIKEINEKSDLDVKYDTVGRGRGGKVYTVIFTVVKKGSKTKLNEEATQDKLSEDDRLAFFDEVKELLGFKLKDCIAISEKSGFNLEKIKKAKDAMDNYSGDIENEVGFMIHAIEHPFENTSSKSGSGTSKKNSKAHNFEERQYNFDDLQKKLVEMS